MSDLVEYKGKRYFQIGKAKNGNVQLSPLKGPSKFLLVERSEIKKIPDGGVLSKREKAFARQLGELLKKYDVELHETIDGDGIHVTMEGREIFVMAYGLDLIELAK